MAGDTGTGYTVGDLNAGKYRQVALLFASEMSALGYAQEQIENGKSLWADFVRKRHPRVAKPGVYAATVEYAIARLDFLDSVTQVDVARRYGVSVSSVTRVYNELMHQLDIELFDERYCTIDTPLEAPPGTLEGLGLPQVLLGDVAQEDAPEPLALEPSALRRLKLLPAADETWSGCRESLRAYLVQPTPFRPDVALWVHEPSELIVGQKVLYPDEDEAAVLEGLVETMSHPAAGPARRPRRLRVEDEWLAGRLAPAVEPLEIEVLVEPTPVVEQILGYMETSLAAESTQDTFFETPEVCCDTVADFFHGAARLWRAAPWSVAGGQQVIAVDLHRWGYERACVSVFGGGEADPGLLIFRSMEEYLAFEELSDLDPRPDQAVMVPLVEVLAVTFMRGDALHRCRRKEVLRHGWEVECTTAYPLLAHTDADNICIPLSPQTYRAARACADSVSLFCAAHADVFRLESPRLTSEVVHLPGWADEEPVVVSAPHPDMLEF